MHEQVQRYAAVMRDQGLQKGDRVIIYLPMIAESLIAMLACLRLGAIHSVVFGGFAPQNLAQRIDDAGPGRIRECCERVHGAIIDEYEYM